MKYIGMDAHSRTSTFIVLGKSGRVLNRARVNTTEKNILAFVRSVNGRKKLAFEEGELAQWLYLLLKEEVEELVVCQPRKRNGPKNDERDAGETADLLRVGRLKSVFHADSELMHLRTLVSGYADVIKGVVQAKNRYKALYREVGLPTNEAGFYSRAEMSEQLDTDIRRHVAHSLFEQIHLLEEQRRGYLDLFKANVRSCELIGRLSSIPGIGPVHANQIAAVMVTPSRFVTKYKLYAYAMLTKHKRESDGKLYGRKRAQGSRVLKNVFKTAAKNALLSQNAFRRKYDAMREVGKDDRAARGAVARQIAATVLGVWKSGQKYNDRYMEVTRRQSQDCHSGK